MDESGVSERRKKKDGMARLYIAAQRHLAWGLQIRPRRAPRFHSGAAPPEDVPSFKTSPKGTRPLDDALPLRGEACASCADGPTHPANGRSVLLWLAAAQQSGF